MENHETHQGWNDQHIILKYGRVHQTCLDIKYLLQRKKLKRGMTKMLQAIWIDECKVRCKSSTFDVKWDSECEDSSSVKAPCDKALLSKNPKPKPWFVETTYIDSSKSLSHHPTQSSFPWFSGVFFISSLGPRQRHALASHVASCCGALPPWRRRQVKSSAFCSPGSFDSEVALTSCDQAPGPRQLRTLAKALSAVSPIRHELVFLGEIYQWYFKN